MSPGPSSTSGTEERGSRGRVGDGCDRDVAAAAVAVGCCSTGRRRNGGDAGARATQSLAAVVKYVWMLGRGRGWGRDTGVRGGREGGQRGGGEQGDPQKQSLIRQSEVVNRC